MSYYLLWLEDKAFELVEVRKTEATLTLVGQSTVHEQACPYCGIISRKIHSYYQRQPQDLPCQGVQVRLQLRAKRFRCANPQCTHRTFAERFSTLVGWHQQRTLRLDDLLEAIAFQLGGETGARCLRALAIDLSGDTLLRVMRRFVPPTVKIGFKLVLLRSW